MTTILHCIRAKTPTIGVHEHIGWPVLKWLAQHNGMILWHLEGCYGLVQAERIKELDRLYKQNDKADYVIQWSTVMHVPPVLGTALFTA